MFDNMLYYALVHQIVNHKRHFQVKKAILVLKMRFHNSKLKIHNSKLAFSVSYAAISLWLQYLRLYICRGVSTNHTFFYKTNPIFNDFVSKTRISSKNEPKTNPNEPKTKPILAQKEGRIKKRSQFSANISMMI